MPYCSGYPDNVTNLPPNPFTQNLFRVLFALEFLLALQVIFTFWSQVGGQYHLDLMFWPWKFGLSLLAAALIVAITARRAVRVCCLLLVLTIATAGVVTYYYHLNEPADEEDSDEPSTQMTRLEGPIQASAIRSAMAWSEGFFSGS